MTSYIYKLSFDPSIYLNVVKMDKSFNNFQDLSQLKDIVSLIDYSTRPF